MLRAQQSLTMLLMPTEPTDDLTDEEKTLFVA